MKPLFMIAALLLAAHAHGLRFVSTWNFVTYKRVIHVYSMTAHGTQDATTIRIEYRMEVWQGPYGACSLVDEYDELATYMNRITSDPLNAGYYIETKDSGETGTWGPSNVDIKQNVPFLDGCFCFCTVLNEGSNWRYPLQVVGDEMACEIYSFSNDTDPL